jgi:hypothetical protein
MKMRNQKQGSTDSEDKLFQPPKKPSKDYTKAIMELKGLVLFILKDKDINTGRELLDIKQAVDGYLNPHALSSKTSLMDEGIDSHKVFMSLASLA